MKWTKLGKIFDPKMHQLPNNCHEFAQSPQVLVFEDFIRIYFSTREKDKTGKFLSHIAFTEVDKKLQKILQVSATSVINLGAVGCFDEHGIFPFNVIRNENKVFGYISGWSRRTSVPVETSIGLAVSNDNGLSFNRIGEGPILTSTLDEPFLVGDPFVLKENGIFHMWYIYGLSWIMDPEEGPARIYKIGHATSIDGISWIKSCRQIIPDKINNYECQALPSVIKIGDKYHMVFCYRFATGFRNNRERAYRIGYAYSYDLVDWQRDDDVIGIDVSKAGWDSDMMCYPHLCQWGGDIYMLYNGNEFGRHGFGAAILDRD